MYENIYHFQVKVVPVWDVGMPMCEAAGIELGKDCKAATAFAVVALLVC